MLVDSRWERREVGDERRGAIDVLVDMKQFVIHVRELRVINCLTQFLPVSLPNHYN